MNQQQPTLIIRNCYSFLTGLPQDKEEILWKALRFTERNYRYSRLFKQKLWDGYTEFYKKTTGRFLTGLLPEIELALNHWNIEYKTIDERGSSVKFIHNKIDKDFLKNINPIEFPHDLYDYQVALVNQVLKYHRGIISASTGAGKTECMISVIKSLPENCPTLILTNKSSLTAQNFERANVWGINNLGRIYENYNEPNIMTCANVQSLHKMEKVLPKIKVLIVDEIHDMMSKVPKKFYNKMTGATVRIAFSATWEKFGGKDKCQKYFVKGYFGPELKIKGEFADKKGVVRTKKLQEKGILSSSICNFWTINEPNIPYHLYQDAVTEGIAENKFLHDVVKKIIDLKCKGRTLILVERIKHGDMLHELIPESFWIAGKDDIETRKYVIGMLSKNNSNRAIGLATQGIFNAGINVHVHNLINAAGGKAEHIIIQRMGRGLRSCSDKEILNYHDFIFKNNDYLQNHSEDRISILKKEGHKIIIHNNFDELI